MKKIIFFFILMFSILIKTTAWNPDPVVFESKLLGNDSVNAGETITYTVYSSIDDIDFCDYNTIMVDLDYDKSKLDLVSSVGLNGWTAGVSPYGVNENGIALWYTSSGSPRSVSIGTLVFRAKDVASATTDLYISNTTTDICTSIFIGNRISKKLNIIGKSVTNIPTVTVQPSGNNKLKGLALSTGELYPSFSPSVKSYNVSVPYSVKEINISATAADTTSKISGAGTKSLVVGENVIYIIVTAENGSKTTYTLTVDRLMPSDNNKLNSLTIDMGKLKPVFDKNVTVYSVTVSRDIENIKITASSDDSKAIVTGTGEKNLSVGKNVFDIVVQSENGSKKTYTLNVTRASSKQSVSDSGNDKEGNKNHDSTFIIVSIVTLLICIAIVYKFIPIIIKKVRIRKN